MLITLLTTGSRGDVQPMIALALGLEAAGYQTRIATDPGFEKLVKSYNLNFSPMACNFQAALATMSQADPGGNRVRFMYKAVGGLRELVRNLNQEAWQACQGADLVIYHPGVAGAFYMARKLNIRAIPVYYQPFFPSAHFPSVMVAAGHPPFKLPGAVNRLTHYLTEQFFWQIGRSQVVEWSKKENLTPKPAFFGPFKQIRQERNPLLLAFSPQVIPPPPDWPDYVHTTGYWQIKQEQVSHWQPPANLEKFLANGLPPVYIGFGSMVNPDPGKTGRLVLEAVRQANQRAIIATSGALSLEGLDLPDTVLSVEEVPHSWLFPKMRAVVHHGGAGTTAAGLAAGVPGLVVSFLGTEQTYWGKRLEALGAGAPPFTFNHLSVERLVPALRIIATDSNMQSRAKQLGELIRTENGVTKAVRVIQELSNHAKPDWVG